MRYVGGKARIARYLGPKVLEFAADRQIVEPFCGALSMTMAIKPVAISDASEPLVRLLTAIREGWQPPYMTEERYKELRKQDTIEAIYAGLCCTWGGKWWGGFARPHPNQPDPQRTTMETIVKRVTATKDIPLQCTTYDKLAIPTDAVIYCDPPYDGTTQSYAGVKKFDSKQFWEWVRETIRNNAVIVSEYQAPDFMVPYFAHHTNFSLHGRPGREVLFVPKELS